jgi:hypothetical protein
MNDAEPAALKGGTNMRGFIPFGVIAAVIGGCGDGSDPGAGGSGGGGGSADAEAPRQRGSIAISSEVYASTLGDEARWDLQISYGELYEGPIAANCFPERIDNCVVLDCPESLRIAPQYGEMSAGTVTVSGGAQPVTVAPDGGYYGITGSNEEGLYAPGETITVDIAGDGDIPAHTLTATAPPAITIIAPDVGPPEPLTSRVTIDLSQDLLVEWTNGSTGTVRAGLGAHDAYGERRTSVACTADASAGQMTIPSGILSRVMRTGNETETGFSVTLFDAVETMAGDCAVSFSVESPALTPEGYRVRGEATLL